MTSELVDPPKTELGYSTGTLPGWGAIGKDQGLSAGDPLEDVPQLAWPNNVVTFHRMRTDAQIDALMKSVWLPLSRLNWMINPNGASEEVVVKTATALNLPIKGNNDEPIQQGRKRFDFREHLRLSLLAPLCYGHMPFEMVGVVDGDTLENLKWRLTKLATRMPQTIARFDIARNGDLNQIIQFGTPGLTPNATWKSPFSSGIPIPRTQLAMYVWEREGGNWAGRSMMRPLYKYWLLKDRMLRIDAMKNERFGIGVPTGTAPQGGDPADYQKMAGAIRASENGGVGLPYGATIGIEGIKGSLPDTLASIRMYDEQMARSWLLMVLQLGQTETGSRALGDTFVDFFGDSLWAFANWFIGTTNNEVIEDFVDWNWGQEENAPLLMAEERPSQPLGAQELANLVRAGALLVDDELQGWIRQRFNMPEYEGAQPIPTKPGDVIQTEPGGTPAKATRKVRKVRAHGGDTHDQKSHGNRTGKSDVSVKVTKDNNVLSLPGTGKVSQVTFGGAGGNPTTVAQGGGGGTNAVVIPLASAQTVDNPKIGHREPSAIEVQAKTDFAALQKAWQDATQKLVKAWGDIRGEQIDALGKAVEAAAKAGDETALATLDAPVLGEEEIMNAMVDAASNALSDAIAEAAGQGVTIPQLDVADLATQLQGRATAVANLLARGLGQAASNSAMVNYASGVDPADVASAVVDKLNGLTDSYLNDQLGGALTQAQNTARMAVFQEGNASHIYASELLDEATCEECAAEDGTEFDTMADAVSDYPAGGYANCLGGARCRGTLVAIYGEPTD